MQGGGQLISAARLCSSGAHCATFTLQGQSSMLLHWQEAAPSSLPRQLSQGSCSVAWCWPLTQWWGWLAPPPEGQQEGWPGTHQQWKQL